MHWVAHPNRVARTHDTRQVGGKAPLHLARTDPAWPEFLGGLEAEERTARHTRLSDHKARVYVMLLVPAVPRIGETHRNSVVNIGCMNSWSSSSFEATDQLPPSSGNHPASSKNQK